MSKAKNPSTSSGLRTEVIEVTEPPKIPISRFSGFGNTSLKRPGGPKFSPKTINSRPTFVTQHKGGGGK